LAWIGAYMPPKNLVDEMVDRFLGWKLPEHFCPDAGISFTPEFNVEYMAKLGKPPMRHEPIGTNLFTADQAREMIEHMLGRLSKEYQVMMTNPYALMALADWHDAQIAEGEAMGFDCSSNAARAEELRTEAHRLAIEWGIEG
jgi:hypothetical protein